MIEYSKDLIIILFHPDYYADENRNVIAVNPDGKVIWQINIDIYNPKFYYTTIKIRAGLLEVNNFSTIQTVLVPETGTVVHQEMIK